MNPSRLRQAAARIPYYDVTVIGGGHAGTEAAAAASRMGAKVALVTHKTATVGALSCNPSIGGVGKGHLVREIDALHGVMPTAADEAAIQFRTLNSSRGAAVRGPRAQIDRQLYHTAVNDILSNRDHASLTIIEASAHSFVVDQRDSPDAAANVVGLRLENGPIDEIRAGALVLTTGTFLNGRMFVGSEQEEGGRRGDETTVTIANALREHGLKLGRMKTGTPPRIWRHSIDTENLLREESDEHPLYFSFLTDESLSQSKKQSDSLVTCFQTRTTKKSHDIVRQALAQGEGPPDMCENGPRYCPSLEKKVIRFGDRNGHVVWLEPEGLHSDLIYPAGISMSLNSDAQQRVINSIGGMERAEIAIPGYAVEYDYVDPRELYRNLELRKLNRLFLAGQINGTTGYEEAAAQGIIAGINAALKAGVEQHVLANDECVDEQRDSSNDINEVRQLESGFLQLRRDDGYIGVLLDDLTRLGTSEPYRMLTSRAEYRIILRPDNADARLTPVGRAVGCISGARWQAFCAKQDDVAKSKQLLRGLKLRRSDWEERGLGSVFEGWKSTDDVKLSAWEILSRPEIGLGAVCAAVSDVLPGIDAVCRQREIVRHVEAECKYESHVQRMDFEISRIRRDDGLCVDSDFDYAAIRGLSIEDLEKLSGERPKSLGEAGQISGVSAAGIELVRSHIRRNEPRPVENRAKIRMTRRG